MNLSRPKNIHLLESRGFNEETNANIRSLVTKIKDNNGVYNYLAYKGKIPEYVVDDIYYNRALTMCSSVRM